MGWFFTLLIAMYFCLPVQLRAAMVGFPELAGCSKSWCTDLGVLLGLCPLLGIPISGYGAVNFWGWNWLWSTAAFAPWSVAILWGMWIAHVQSRSSRSRTISSQDGSANDFGTEQDCEDGGGDGGD